MDNRALFPIGFALWIYTSNQSHAISSFTGFHSHDISTEVGEGGTGNRPRPKSSQVQHLYCLEGSPRTGGCRIVLPANTGTFV